MTEDELKKDLETLRKLMKDIAEKHELHYINLFSLNAEVSEVTYQKTEGEEEELSSYRGDI